METIRLGDNVRRFLNVQSLDPDDARRRKLLNILLFGTLATALLGLTVTLFSDVFGLIVMPRTDFMNLYIACVFTILLCGVIFLTNRYWSGRLAAFLFLLLTLVVAVFFDEPAQVVDGRSLLWCAIPILGGSMLISPPFSFVMAVLSSLAIIAIGLGAQLTPSPIGMIGFLIIAMVSWLAARTMERALKDLRSLNEELDQRVQDRTKELAQALRREHTLAVRNKTILESIADGVLVFDANQQVVMANPAASRLAQRDLHAVNLPQFLTTIEDKARETIRSWMMGQKPAELSNVKFQWDDRAILANVAPVILPGAEASQAGDGNVMVLRDFTKEATLERAKDMFLGMVSHELRTPMSAIQGYVNMLSLTEKERLSTEGREYLQTINISIKQLLTLANELIDVSRLETGEVALYPQWIDLTTIVNNAVKVVRQEFTNRKLALEVKLAEHLPQLYVDQTRINQVLLNLLSNAYKYTSEGGATLEVSQTNGWVNIVVSDTGIGIKTEDQEKMFERFFRSSDRAVQKASGTGLGLNITKGLVELHGGQLTFDSTYGQGTTFRVTLPVRSEAAVAKNLPNGNL